MNLKEQTHALLMEHMKYRDNTYKKIAKAAGVGEYWLMDFKKDPDSRGYNFDDVQRLYDYLTEWK